MSTRSLIVIREGRRVYKIYRHSDGYPEGVLSDFKVFFERNGKNSGYRISDPEYFLANFIFYAKLCFMAAFGDSTTRPWEGGYGVCGEGCKHGDLEYIYEIDVPDRITIRSYHFKKGWQVEFMGSLTEAISKYAIYENGCHINMSSLIALKLGK